MDTTAYTANEAKTTTVTTATSEGPGIGFDQGYLLSLHGILTAVIGCSAFCLAISAIVPPIWWQYTSIASYSAFVGWEIFIVHIIIYLFYMLRVIPKLPGPIGLAILIYMLVNIFFLFISIILCAINIEIYGGPAGSAMAFGLICMGCHFGQGFLLFQKWRTLGHYFHKGECGHTFTTSTATTTTTASSEQSQRY